MPGDEARPQSEQEIKLGFVLALADLQVACQLDASLQVCDGLEVGRAQGGAPARRQPVTDRLFGQSGFGEMVRQSFRLVLRDFREPLLERIRKGALQTSSPALQ